MLLGDEIRIGNETGIGVVTGIGGNAVRLLGLRVKEHLRLDLGTDPSGGRRIGPQCRAIVVMIPVTSDLPCPRQ